jgi:hypothetical protein
VPDLVAAVDQHRWEAQVIARRLKNSRHAMVDGQVAE